jgi:anti-sigma factor RsiW
MRCGRAQKLIVAAVDGELTPERRRELDDHVAGCAECGAELRATATLFGALGSLPQEAEVPALVEAATLRRMRLAAAEERERGGRRWAWLSAPVLAATAVTVLAVVVGTRQEPAPRSASDVPRAQQLARVADSASAAPKREEPAVAVADGAPPPEPPPDLAAAPELFMNLPIIRNMEKLEHFEAISMVELAPNG